ncbi:winged helix-turn-helix transcriptional regulator, partial [Lactococcus lactis]|uniref:winged helix-turn-helix transcriptional regulator n=1 Tax=Lactococcus lactis TaxID=1358 RepID=UPI00210F05D4
YNQVPPKDEYSLSPYAETLNGLLDILCSWGEGHLQTLKSMGEEVLILELENLEEEPQDEPTSFL